MGHFKIQEFVMHPFLALLLTFSLPLSNVDQAPLICKPSGYSQAQGGQVYERVNCIKERLRNPECNDQSFPMGALVFSATKYTHRATLPVDETGYGARIDLDVDRLTGAYKFVVVATDPSERSWKNVKTFKGVCANAKTQVTLVGQGV
jgi:hypothetical protein